MRSYICMHGQGQHYSVIRTTHLTPQVLGLYSKAEIENNSVFQSKFNTWKQEDNTYIIDNITIRS